MWILTRPVARGYLVAVISTGLAIIGRMTLDPFLGNRHPHALFYLAVVVAAWAGGRGPAILAVALGGLAADFLFIPPRGTHILHAPGDTFALLTFAGVGLALGVLTDRLRTARREAAQLNEALRRRAEELQAVLDVLPVGVFIAEDPAGTVIRANPAGNAMFGRSAVANTLTSGPESNGLPCRTLRNGAEVPAAELPMQQAVREARPVGGDEVDVARADGSVIHLYEYAVPLFDPNGRVRGCVGAFVDVTRLRQAERDLRESERLLRLIIDAVPALISYVGPDERYQLVNATYERWFGRPQADFRGRRMRESLGDAAWEKARPYVERALTGEEVTFANTVPYQTRGPRDVQISYTPDRAADGRVRGLVVLVNDLSDRVKAEKDLQRTADRLQFALSAADMGDWSWDPPTDRVVLSRRAAEIFGIPAVPPRTRPAMRDLLHPDDRDRVAREVDRVVGLRIGYDIEYRVARSDGAWKWVAAKGRAQYDAAGTVVGMSGVVQDVTGPRELQEELRQTVAALREADRLKDEFLAMLAHELRNPLAPIRNALHILKKTADDPTTRDLVRATAERQVAHMARLLDDLLDVSRISRGKIELRCEPTDLVALVGRTVEAARSLIDGGRHLLTVNIAPGPIWINGDPTRLEQVVMNLLANAAKYTDPGGRVALEVEFATGAGNSATSSHFALVTVRDTGIGISTEMLPRVFDLFVQAERRVERSRGGIGIGLTLVKRLVEAHGGTVAARSNGPGTGSEFEVALPTICDWRGEEKVNGEAVKSWAPRRVLVVDDNSDAADSLALLLQMDGHESRAVYDGSAALALVPEYQPEVVFLDLGMPGLNGWEVCRNLRAQVKTSTVRLVALTGWGQEGDRQRSAAAGFDAHLVKPADPEAIRRALGDPTVNHLLSSAPAACSR